MSALVEPMRIVLLAETPAWKDALRVCLAELGAAIALITAPSWAAASALFDEEPNAVLLATPACQPPPGQCPVPLVLLLEREPPRPPESGDWLVRDSLSADALRRCLRYARERGNLHVALRRLAEQDPLTGIVNRQGFQTLLAARLAEFEGRGLALGYLDLDNFRHVNDALGYQSGDRLILQVVSRLKGQLEAGDLLARMGGDEFGLLLDVRRDPARLERIAEGLVEALAEPYRVDGESLLLGCSLGLARADDADSDADRSMWHAHIAMQQAKNAQGCSFHVFDPRLNRGARSLAEREGELRRALRCDQLELHYQPRLCLKSGRILGLEALVRWRHAERGLLTPDEFIPLAEESGLIVPLGYWVMSRALRDMQWLRGRGLEPLHMAVNLSFRQFQDSQLLSTLSRLIEERGVEPQWLEFELTETAVMRRSEQVLQTMQALERLGVRFSLDDFGTGFSSFVHLNSLPITLLKIDKGFVGGIDSRPANRRLVRAMIALAHTLGLEVVAEGVETAAQLAQLREFGCDQVQGFWISKPLPLNELARFLVFGMRRPAFAETLTDAPGAGSANDSA
ncbi:bifunctional diguanylate cyclase/phosphodiesterase [Pseudomonas alcaligenes]|uniref:putative bifunctional diguanylate cyclase/phosphodiesterase n=1 Tax=Pseudomonas sp. RIT-PI-AD TaxID=3035294 RepID=UPI0021D80A1F